jgi:hypothetical protein
LLAAVILAVPEFAGAV